MTRAPRTPAEAFVATLASLARRHPQIDGLVFWHDGTGWPETPSQDLDPEEIPFFAEGLVDEGFHLHWRLAGTAEAPGPLLLFVSEDPAAAPPAPGQPALAGGRWPPPPPVVLP